MEPTKKELLKFINLWALGLYFVNPNIVNICSFLTSIAEGHLYLGLVSECRITKNTTNDITFFYILRIKEEYFMTTLTMADTKQEKWWLKI